MKMVAPGRCSPPTAAACAAASWLLLVLLSALADPDQYHSSSSELGGDSEFMDDANMCTAITISVLMVLIWAAAVHGAYKQHVTRIIPFFCYQIFGFALNTFVAVTVLVCPSSIQEYIGQCSSAFLSLLVILWNSAFKWEYLSFSPLPFPSQLPPNFPHKDDIMSVNPICLVLIIFLFISIILTFKDYLISCVWNCWASLVVQRLKHLPLMPWFMFSAVTLQCYYPLPPLPCVSA
ncbi:hypothetical protein FD754_022665 [Muntiacus muntjak]|uniref:Uncharacterized protein n=1 Tax=Muntiacus muntjak TaxID=9888 RepID=A0A5N3V9H1_MUNMU|nr:hypothetical protein FD754_022665 [Muntiacus muntjak]